MDRDYIEIEFIPESSRTPWIGVIPSLIITPLIYAKSRQDFAGVGCWMRASESQSLMYGLANATSVRHQIEKLQNPRDDSMDEVCPILEVGRRCREMNEVIAVIGPSDPTPE